MKALSFKLSENPVFEDNPEFRSIPEFERLTERQMRYVMLVDYHGSPLRLMKPELRRNRAAILAGYKFEKDGKRLDVNARNVIGGKDGSIEAARKVLAEIQYDNEWELMEALNTQIEGIIEFFKKPEKTMQELDKSVTLMTKLPAILETKKKILEILNFRDQDFVNTVEITTTEDITSIPLIVEFNQDKD